MISFHTQCAYNVFFLICVLVVIERLQLFVLLYYYIDLKTAAMVRLLKKISFFGFVVFMLSACNFFDEPSWETDMLTPIASSSISINNIIRNDTTVKVNPDSSITLVYQESLLPYTLDSLVALDVDPFIKNVTIQSLVLSDITVTRTITLGEIARSIGGLQGNAILAAHGSFQCFPNINGISAGPFAIDLSAFFESAELDSGYIDLSITNGFPLDISNLNYQLDNQSGGPSIVNDNIAFIASGTTFNQTPIDIGGSTIESSMEVTMNNLDLNSGCGTIDTNDAVTITATIRDIKVNSATAIFPAQNVVDNTEEFGLENMGDVELVEAEVEAGFVRIEVISTMGDSIFFNYKIPSAELFGVPFETDVVVPPAPSPGDTSNVVLLFDFRDYVLDLTGDPFGPDTVNTMYSELVGRIDSTGQLVSLSLDDSVFIRIDLLNVQPRYVRGYLGQDTISLAGTNNLNIFDNILSGAIDIFDPDVNIALTIENGLGINGNFVLNSAGSANTGTGANQALTCPALLGSNVPIAAATDGPLTPSITSVNYNTVNCGSPTFASLLEILPDQISFDLEMRTNPGGNTGAYSDFAYFNNSLDARLDIELPLYFFSNSLVMADTVDFILAELESPEQVKSGIFTFMIENGFPIDADIKIFFLDEFDTPIDSLVAPTTVLAAPTAGSPPRVTMSELTQLDFAFDEARMQRLFLAEKVVFWADFNTQPGSTHLKIYSDYKMDFKIIGDFQYRVN